MKIAMVTTLQKKCFGSNAFCLVIVKGFIKKQASLEIFRYCIFVVHSVKYCDDIAVPVFLGFPEIDDDMIKST